MNQYNKYNPRFKRIAAPLFATFLLMLTIKGGDQTTVGDFVIEVPQLNYILGLKAYATAIASVSIFLFLATILTIKIDRREKIFGLHTGYFLIFMLYLLRQLFEGDVEPLRFIGATILNTLIWLFVFLLGGRPNRPGRRADFFIESMNIWAIAFIALNTITYLLNFGYPEDGNRFFGITQHPNFLGVSCAHAALIFLQKTINEKRLSRIFYAGLLLLSTFFTTISLSRTSILMLVVGFFSSIFIFPQNNRFSRRAKFLLITFAIIASAVFIIRLEDIASSITATDDRLTENTRSAVWLVMISNFLENPIFGVGAQIGGSESSFLKLLSSSGIFPGLGFIIIVGIAIRTSFVARKSRFRKLLSKNEQTALVLLFTTITGSFLEGYLVELAGPWLIVYLFEIAIVSDISTRIKAHRTASNWLKNIEVVNQGHTRNVSRALEPVHLRPTSRLVDDK